MNRAGFNTINTNSAEQTIGNTSPPHRTTTILTSLALAASIMTGCTADTPPLATTQPTSLEQPDESKQPEITSTPTPVKQEEEVERELTFPESETIKNPNTSSVEEFSNDLPAFIKYLYNQKPEAFKPDEHWSILGREQDGHFGIITILKDDGSIIPDYNRFGENFKGFYELEGPRDVRVHMFLNIYLFPGTTPEFERDVSFQRIHIHVEGGLVDWGGVGWCTIELPIKLPQISADPSEYAEVIQDMVVNTNSPRVVSDFLIESDGSGWTCPQHLMDKMVEGLTKVVEQ